MHNATYTHTTQSPCVSCVLFHAADASDGTTKAQQKRCLFWRCMRCDQWKLCSFKTSWLCPTRYHWSCLKFLSVVGLHVIICMLLCFASFGLNKTNHVAWFKCSLKRSKSTELGFTFSEKYAMGMRAIPGLEVVFNWTVQQYIARGVWKWHYIQYSYGRAFYAVIYHSVMHGSSHSHSGVTMHRALCVKLYYKRDVTLRSVGLGL